MNLRQRRNRPRGLLAELQLDKKTLVVYFSDNGPNSWRWNGGMKGRKDSTEEGGVRVPCLVRWPSHIPPGRDGRLELGGRGSGRVHQARPSDWCIVASGKRRCPACNLGQRLTSADVPSKSLARCTLRATSPIAVNKRARTGTGHPVRPRTIRPGRWPTDRPAVPSVGGLCRRWLRAGCRTRRWWSADARAA
jgi:hypothetical protein